MGPQREWFEKDYYKILGVSDKATPKELTKAYRKLARELHPDANPDNASAEEKFKEVSAAYDVVGDEAKRKEYDEARAIGPMAGGFGGPSGGGPQGGFNFRAEDLGDLFGGLFGRGRAGAGGSRGPGPQRGDDLETELHLSFRDAVKGITTSVALHAEAACSTCHGSGARPGTSPVPCPQCGGRGVIDQNQGLFSFSQPCPSCAGRGSVITDPCPTCHGSGTQLKARNVRVRIPPGVKNGQRIRLKGKGGAGRNGGPAGDLYVVNHVARDPRFGRDGNDLTITVPITFPEAALGTNVTVPTLDGEPVTLKIPAGTPNGKRFRVKGRGIEAKNGLGSLVVTTEVTVPSELSAAEREAVEALRDASTGSPRDHLDL